ncbi:MAG: hypothetical protein KatS3mg105_3067 [Gemmatales bacterium]|nr:MAG: hypothetical protein KatS3mg105_3067 [Gemmatales bacterium]
MWFWIRELGGWALVGLGLFGFYICAALLSGSPPRLIESIPMTFISFIVFRGGIQLLKTAVAARICLEADRRLSDEGQQRPPRRDERPKPMSRPAVR